MRLSTSVSQACGSMRLSLAVSELIPMGVIQFVGHESSIPACRCASIPPVGHQCTNATRNRSNAEATGLGFDNPASINHLKMRVA